MKKRPEKSFKQWAIWSLLLFAFSLAVVLVLNIAGIHEWSTNTLVIFIGVGVFVVAEKLYKR